MRRYPSRLIWSLSEEEQNNKAILLKLINEDAGAFRFAAEHLRDDQKVAYEAVKRDPFLMRYVSERLRGDKDFAHKCFAFHLGDKKYGDERIKLQFDHLSEELQSILRENGYYIGAWKQRADEERWAANIRRKARRLPMATPRARL